MPAGWMLKITQGLLSTVLLFPLAPNLTRPIIPAKAGIHAALIWILAFAGIVGRRLTARRQWEKGLRSTGLGMEWGFQLTSSGAPTLKEQFRRRP